MSRLRKYKLLEIHEADAWYGKYDAWREGTIMTADPYEINATIKGCHGGPFTNEEGKQVVFYAVRLAEVS